MQQPQVVVHPLEPVFDGNSRVLVLGTMPSPKSRETGFYYGHPQNRFWKILERLFEESPGEGAHERAAFCLRHGIALWDVVASCTICGASDASIRDVVPNDAAWLLSQTRIKAVFVTGRTAARLYRCHCQPATGIPATFLPSSSAANAAMRLDDLVESYRGIRDCV